MVIEIKLKNPILKDIMELSKYLEKAMGEHHINIYSEKDEDKVNKLIFSTDSKYLY